MPRSVTGQAGVEEQVNPALRAARGGGPLDRATEQPALAGPAASSINIAARRARFMVDGTGMAVPYRVA